MSQAITDLRVLDQARIAGRIELITGRALRRLVKLMGGQEKAYDLPLHSAFESPSHRLYIEQVAPHVRR
jgi:hypothetical protein